MKIAISVPTGYHKRELFMPLTPLLQADKDITRVLAISPAAAYRTQIFPEYREKFEFITNPADAADHKKLFQDWQPEIVVTSTAGHEERDVPILRAAKELGIPTLTFIASWDNVWKMERMIRFGKPQVVSDHFVVWNVMMRDHLLRIFPVLRPEQVVVIGAPRFDYFSHHDQIPSEDELRNYLGVPPDGKLIHFSSTELYPMDYIVKTIKRSQADQPAASPLHFFVSVHPGGDLAHHQSMAKYGALIGYSFGRQPVSPVPDFRYNPSVKDIYMHVALFKYSAMLINQSSTTVMESLLADVPIINVAFGKKFDWWHWYRSMVYRDFFQHYADVIMSRATSLVKNRRELVRACYTYLEHPECQRAERAAAIKKMITTVDGTASLKVLNFIKLCAAE